LPRVFNQQFCAGFVASAVFFAKASFLQKQMANAAIKLAHGLAALPRHVSRMNEITPCRK
jgi:hypothetical protein